MICVLSSSSAVEERLQRIAWRSVSESLVGQVSHKSSRRKTAARSAALGPEVGKKQRGLRVPPRTKTGLARCSPWLRTNGVNTNGAAAKVMDFDRLGKKVRPGTFGEIKVG